MEWLVVAHCKPIYLINSQVLLFRPFIHIFPNKLKLKKIHVNLSLAGIATVPKVDIVKKNVVPYLDIKLRGNYYFGDGIFLYMLFGFNLLTSFCFVKIPSNY